MFSVILLVIAPKSSLSLPLSLNCKLPVGPPVLSRGVNSLLMDRLKSSLAGEPRSLVVLILWLRLLGSHDKLVSAVGVGGTYREYKIYI